MNLTSPILSYWYFHYQYDKNFYTRKIFNFIITVESRLSGRYLNYLLSEPRPVRIEPSIVRTIARNFVTKLQITQGLKRDQTLIVYHVVNRQHVQMLFFKYK